MEFAIVVVIVIIVAIYIAYSKYSANETSTIKHALMNFFGRSEIHTSPTPTPGKTPDVGETPLTTEEKLEILKKIYTTF